MKEFKDLNGNAWRLNMTIGAVEKVRDVLGFDLLRPDKYQGESETNYYGRLDEDSLFDFKVIKILCEESIKAYGYDDATVANLFGPAQLKAAREAFQAEYEDFFRASGQPEMIDLLQAMKNLRQAALVDYVDSLNSIDWKRLVEEASKATTEESSAAFGEEFGNGAARSASIPALSLSRNCIECAKENSNATGISPLKYATLRRSRLPTRNTRRNCVENTLIFTNLAARLTRNRKNRRPNSGIT